MSLCKHGISKTLGQCSLCYYEANGIAVPTEEDRVMTIIDEAMEMWDYQNGNPDSSDVRAAIEHAVRRAADVRMPLGSCPGKPACDGEALCDDHKTVNRAILRAAGLEE